MKLQQARQMAATQPGWLSQTPEFFRNEVLKHCTLHQYDTGDALHSEGDAASSMYGVVEGQLKVYMSASDGLVYLTHVMSAGTWGGEGPALIGTARPVSLVAASPTVTLRISHVAMTAITTARPEAWPLFVERLMGHLAVSFTAIADSMIRDQTARVAAILMRLANLSLPTTYHTQNDRNVQIAVSQEELAGIANIGRTTVSAILTRFRDQGLLDLAYGRIIILDAAGLWKIVRG